MKKLLLAGVAAALLAGAAPAYAASDAALVTLYVSYVSPGSSPAPTGVSYWGNCSFQNVNQDIGTGQSWVGEANVALVGTFNGIPNPVAIDTVSCEFLINGVSQGTVLTAPNGTGSTVQPGRFEYAASPVDEVTMCTHATVDHVVQPLRCIVGTVR